MPRSNDDASSQGIFGGHGAGILLGGIAGAGALGIAKVVSGRKFMAKHGGFGKVGQGMQDAMDAAHKAGKGMKEIGQAGADYMKNLEGFDKTLTGRMANSKGLKWGLTGGAVAGGAVIGGLMDQD